ncbi:hypothetical protein OK351_07620 [Glutamicibacter sp. MNS18]|uniref:LppM family (lipo)protein n=1 Tax=Glutamicibacter sp. MNS18 TaxID=2989817 RepID=UPI0022367F99|nr:hypothetical protein [Glutamicibacter sp. MNS18]MCW4465368.1 hypothetical protein [Glutamicibacter sp. MNS18]
MKKLVGVLAMMFTAMLALAGCVDLSAHVTIEGEDKARGAVEVTMDASLLQGATLDEALGSQVDTAQLEQITGENWTYTQINDGVKAGLRFETVQAMNFIQLQDAFQSFELPISLANTAEGFAFSMPGNAPGSTEPGAGTASMSVTFPGHVTGASETGVIEGSTVTFDMIQGAEVYEATGTTNNALFYSIVFGGALLVLTLVIAIAMAPKRVKDDAQH